MKNNRLKYLLPFAVIFVLAGNYIQSILTTVQVLFLIKPVSFLVGEFLGVTFSYSDVAGFLCNEYPIAIEKSCSGFTFFTMLILLGIVTYFLFSESVNLKKSIRSVSLVLLFSYLFTLLVNSIRIITGIKLQIFSLAHSWFPNHIVHELMGVLYFLLSMVLFYTMVKNQKSKIC